MKVKVIDAWEQDGSIAMKYSASIKGREDVEGTVVLPPGPPDSDEMEFLERAMPMIRSRLTSTSPTVQGLLNIAAGGKPVDDGLDRDPPPQQ